MEIIYILVWYFTWFFIFGIPILMISLLMDPEFIDRHYTEKLGITEKELDE